jgi:L-aminopeptidase/D-esterase-like protein
VIEGFEIGHHTASEPGWLTGTTVVLARSGAIGGVDVRGGAPATRETDLLHPTATVNTVNAIVLTGGSAFGLAAANGVTNALAGEGIGFPVGAEPSQVVPIVPAAALFDLGRGGEFGNRPTDDFGVRALAAASGTDPQRGCVGAGTGARCGGLKGGFGYAEAALPSGARVAAAVILNAVGSAVDPGTGRLWADLRRRLKRPSGQEREALSAAAASALSPQNTSIGVILTDLSVSKAEATRLASIGHDGLARAVRPVHGLFDGDTIFSLALGRHPRPADPRETLIEYNEVLTLAADVFTDACFDAMTSASGTGGMPSYRELAPSAFDDAEMATGQEPRLS